MIEAEEAVFDEDIWGSEDLAEFDGVVYEEPGPVTVDHVADSCHRYPGEVVTFYTRIEVRESQADLTLRIAIPPGLNMEDYRCLSAPDSPLPYTEVTEEANYLVWSLEGDLPAGTRYEYQTGVRVAPVVWDVNIESQAVVTTREQETLAEETVTVTVLAKGRYLRHLPAIYEQDDLMGRFLMLFESFWAPVEAQIDNGHYYLDPRITPANFLPWLASWLDLELDERWPVARQRQLIRWAIALHRSRGTKWGLLKYLEIYTGQQAKIVERRAKNFVLGPEARLGPGIALGRINVPHTFTVTLRLPPIEAENEQEQARQEKLRRRTIESIIERQKPAHTVYDLNLETLSSTEVDTQITAEAEVDKSAEEVDEISAQAAIWFKLDDEPAKEDDQPARKKRKSSKRRGKKS